MNSYGKMVTYLNNKGFTLSCYQESYRNVFVYELTSMKNDASISFILDTNEETLKGFLENRIGDILRREFNVEFSGFNSPLWKVLHV